MPLVPQPAWTDFSEIPGPDPATAHDFQTLAAQELGQMDTGDSAVSTGNALLACSAGDGETAANATGLDLANAAAALSVLEQEADADTLLTELTQAAEQDAALGVLAGDVSVSAGGTPTQFPIIPPG